MEEFRAHPVPLRAWFLYALGSLRGSSSSGASASGVGVLVLWGIDVRFPEDQEVGNGCVYSECTTAIGRDIIYLEDGKYGMRKGYTMKRAIIYLEQDVPDDVDERTLDGLVNNLIEQYEGDLTNLKVEWEYLPEGPICLDELQKMAKDLKCALFADRATLDEARNYADMVIGAINQADRMPAYTAMYVVLNTIARKIDETINPVPKKGGD